MPPDPKFYHFISACNVLIINTILTDQMSDPTGFKKAFLSFGVIGVLGAITFYLAQQHVYWNKDEIMAARERIIRAAAKGNEDSRYIQYSKQYETSQRQRELAPEYEKRNL